MDNVKCHSQLALGLNGNTLSFCFGKNAYFEKSLNTNYGIGEGNDLWLSKNREL